MIQDFGLLIEKKCKNARHPTNLIVHDFCTEISGCIDLATCEVFGGKNRIQGVYAIYDEVPGVRFELHIVSLIGAFELSGRDHSDQF